ncbi:MAG TPA: FHA domain-containing protein [Polyangia bacterium]
MRARGLTKAAPTASDQANSDGPVRAVEQPCPNCGQPMLAAWGSTCGNCRPGIAVCKTLCLSSTDLAGTASASGLSLGWLVVVQSPDENRVGSLIDLGAPISVLSRGGRSPAAAQAWIDFADDSMSDGHALVNRPSSNDRHEAFVIRDRQDPGPSTNGTFVNSHKLGRGESVALSEGDMVRVGRTEVCFKSLWLPPGGQGQV